MMIPKKCSYAVLNVGRTGYQSLKEEYAALEEWNRIQAAKRKVGKINRMLEHIMWYGGGVALIVFFIWVATPVLFDFWF